MAREQARRPAATERLDVSYSWPRYSTDVQRGALRASARPSTVRGRYSSSCANDPAPIVEAHFGRKISFSESTRCTATAAGTIRREPEALGKKVILSLAGRIL